MPAAMPKKSADESQLAASSSSRRDCSCSYDVWTIQEVHSGVVVQGRLGLVPSGTARPIGAADKSADCGHESTVGRIALADPGHTPDAYNTQLPGIRNSGGGGNER